MNHTPPVEHKGEYYDRKRTLPKRIVKLALSLAALPAGEYVYVVRVTPDGGLTFQSGVLDNHS